MQSITLLLVLQHTGVGGAELSLIKGLAKTFGCLVHLLLNLLIVLSQLVLDEHVGAITLLRVAVIYQGVIEGINMSAGLPRRGVHEDGCVNTHDVLVQQHHRLPPILLNVILQLHTVLAVVINSA